MPHSPHRRLHHSTAGHHASFSPTLDLAASNKNNDNSNEDDKSEDYNPIIWEDDAVTDLRQLGLGPEQESYETSGG